MIAAVSSGCGKTTITCAILEAIRRRGISAVSFKCGPDYIDPMFHRTVLGIDSINLDSYFSSEDEINDSIYRYGGDISVIEGVMGIYDGIGCDKKGSCYEIAKMTGTPVILVVNAAGAGATIVSVIKGILSDDTEQLIRGIILNRISDSFYKKLLPYLEEEIAGTGNVRVIGHLTDNKDIVIDSRHLGLVLPGEIGGIKDKLQKAADIIEECCDIDAIIETAAAADSSKTVEARNRIRDGKAGCPAVAVRGEKVIAVARDEAFCFYYPQNLGIIEEAGYTIEYFSPIYDKEVPRKALALLLGGGYPELHLEELCRNRSMLRSVRAAIESGMPSIAECGGFMYLHSTIENKNNICYEMTGVIDGKCTFTGHLVNFGYTRISGYAREGKKIVYNGMKGHEFHYFDSTSPGSDLLLVKESSGKEYMSMYADILRLWGFPHLYYPSKPEAIMRFLNP